MDLHNLRNHFKNHAQADHNRWIFPVTQKKPELKEGWLLPHCHCHIFCDLLLLTCSRCQKRLCFGTVGGHAFAADSHDSAKQCLQSKDLTFTWLAKKTKEVCLQVLSLEQARRYHDLFWTKTAAFVNLWPSCLDGPKPFATNVATPEEVQELFTLACGLHDDAQATYFALQLVRLHLLCERRHLDSLQLFWVNVGKTDTLRKAEIYLLSDYTNDLADSPSAAENLVKFLEGKSSCDPKHALQVIEQALATTGPEYAKQRSLLVDLKMDILMKEVCFFPHTRVKHTAG